MAKVSKINQLIQESSGTSGIASGREALIALTRKTQEKIYKELVSTQPTSNPIATVFGMRYDYVQADKEGSTHEVQLDYVTSGGKYPFGKSGLPGPTDGMSKGDKFVVHDFVFSVLEDGDYEYLKSKPVGEAHNLAVRGKLRNVADAADPDTYQDPDSNVAESRFLINKWTARVCSRKLKSPTTIELMYDMERQGLNADLAVEDLLSTAIAEEINIDIITKLITISKKEEPATLVSTVPYYKGRELISRACSAAAEIEWWTSVPATYLVASYKVCGLIRASGQVGDDDIIRGTGMKLIMDGRSMVDYMMVGGKMEDPTGLDHASGLFYSPFQESDEAGSFLVTADYSSLQPVIGVMTRYALSAFPTYDDVSREDLIVQCDDWDNLANTSQFVRTIPVVL